MTWTRNRIIILVALSLFFALTVSFIDLSTFEEDLSIGGTPEPIPQRNSVLSAPPNITLAPIFENPHDSTFFYARARNYQISVNVTDGDGFSDVNYVRLSLWDDTRATEYWTVTYNEDNNTFSKNDPNDHITLVTGSCRYWKSSVVKLDILFVISIEWDHPDTTNTDTRLFSHDGGGENSTSWFETNWAVETRLDYAVSPSVTSDGSGTVDRGNLNEIFHLEGTVIYYGSVDDNPLSDEVDVWVNCVNVSPSSWSALTLTSGAFDVSCNGDDITGRNTYTVKIVEEAAGSGGTDLYHTASAMDSYISDSLTVSITDPSDQRININANASGIVVTATYDYDGSSFDGVFVLNDTTFQYTSVGKRGYTVINVSGDLHGITTIGTNDETYCIWDRLIVNIQADDNAPLGEQDVAFTLVVTFDYDDQVCTTYALLADRNGTSWNSFTYSNRSSFTDNSANIAYEYSVFQITSESLYGITAFTSNTETVVWSAALTTTTTTTTTTALPPVNVDPVVVAIVCAVFATAATGAAYVVIIRPTRVFVRKSIDNAELALSQTLGAQGVVIPLLVAAAVAECLRRKESAIVKKIRQNELTRQDVVSRIASGMDTFAMSSLKDVVISSLKDEVISRLKRQVDALKDVMPEVEALMKLEKLPENLCCRIWDMVNIDDSKEVDVSASGM